MPGNRLVNESVPFSATYLLNDYLKSINNEEVLTKEEEDELFARYRKGDMKARDRIITVNLRFVYLITRSCIGRGLPTEDLLNEGNIGLLEAMKRFDSFKGYRFISYAVWWIRQALFKAIAEQKNYIHIPLNMQCRMVKINAARNRLTQKLGRNPAVEEIAEELNTSVSKVTEAMAFNKKTFHMDDKRTDDKNAATILETIVDEDAASVENKIVCSDFRKEFKKILKILSKTERAVITALYNEEKPMTLDEVSKRFKLPLSRINQLVKQGFTKIKNSPEANNLRRYMNENMQRDSF